MKMTYEDYLAHYGTPRHSGRYPWGSGEDPYQDNKSFLGMVADMRKKGLNDTEIARGLGMTSTEFRQMRTIARNEVRAADMSQAQRMKDRGWSNVEIGKRMGIGESQVRALLAPGARDKIDVMNATTDMLRDQVSKKKWVDVGTGVEQGLGITENKLKTAVAQLRKEGYELHPVKLEQLGTGHKTEYKVLSPPGTTQKDAWLNRHNIQQIQSHSDDGGRTYLGIEPPKSLDSKRVAINYSKKNAKGEEIGGAAADGVIYVRPGVEDLSLGKSNYAQVRIAVDGTHFMKGMAMYKPDLPEGVDVVYNTNKSENDPKIKSKLDVMKPMKTVKATGEIDQDNPFGAVIKPGGQRGVLNIINEEGDWSEWSRNLSSQFLSKQSPVLAKEQLDVTVERSKSELEDIMSLTNPAVRRKLLESYADGADSAAVQLKAAALPRQGTHVILPVDSLKSNEIYAPNFDNGDRVVLVRFPHGGTFEIPELTVNNKHREAKKLLGPQAQDAVGINARVAERLSGADFDGDTVLVIPNNKGRVKTTAALEGLKDFDPKRTYPKYEGMKVMSPRTKQIEMGNVSNLITDMTIRGASTDELARAVRHSMVVIDAEKHELNYKQSAIDNGIAALKEKYQGGKRKGASTLISRKKSSMDVAERKQGYTIDPTTGKKIYRETGATRVDRKTGELVPRTQSVRKLAETDDANTLSSGVRIEKVYADYSNRMKALGNQARLELLATKTTPYSPSAKAAYASEVASLDSKLRTALANRPRERQAVVLSNAIVAKKRQDNPGMEQDELKKLKYQALAEARTRTGARKEQIEITPSEWDAIQSGAISNAKLTDILNNTDLDQVKKLATPKSAPAMTAAKTSRARSMAALGYTQAEIASALGVSVSTITEAIGG